ncbi:hypothetical protein BDV96DRAFT_604147 [Lophiotrema nucula]|uniref:Myb-like domain-containing protein n=1 Tax=Lophiotrema nucula TaxID=690887 RepID=A0A6A5YSA2_9PLEO|nr:hypothetical protein BDV96DRAFT_604147 [Lophiotrema nucula]
MPKVDKAPTQHRSSISTASAAAAGVRSSSWSAKDDETLMVARAQGHNWNQIAPKHFPSKSPNACRKRHERLMERQHQEQWDGVKLQDLAQAYMAVRKDMWTLLADRLGGGEKWAMLEQKCMEKGLKNLNQAHRSAQRKQSVNADDSGFATNSDYDDESPADERHHELQSIPDGSTQFPVGFSMAPPAPHTQRIPSIAMLTQQHTQFPSQYHHSQH